MPSPTETMRVGDEVVMAEIACDSEDDIGTIVSVGPGDVVSVAWTVAGQTYQECVDDLVKSEAL